MRFDESSVAEKYDYVIFDCPPTLNLVTYNVLTLTKHLLIPCGMDLLSLAGVQTILENIALIEKYFQRRPNILGLLPTAYDQRTSISDDVMTELKKGEDQGLHLFQPIRIDSKLKYAQVAGQTVFDFAPQSRASEDYLVLTKGILAKFKVSSKVKEKSKHTQREVEVRI